LLQRAEEREGPSTAPLIEANNICYTYRQANATVNALQGVSFTLSAGGSCAVIGPSGSGKTTLLYLLAGLMKADSGELHVGGKPARVRQGTSLILQDYGLLPWKTVWDNARLGLQVRRAPMPEQQRRVAEVLTYLGLNGHESHYPAQLSGGQRQRVAIARSLATSPDLLLMDEPLSSLDALTREDLQDTVIDIWSQGKLTFVLVTHNIEEAVYLGQKVLVMSEAPGRIVEVVENPDGGRKGYRGTAAYYHQCNLVRRLLTAARHQDHQGATAGEQIGGGGG